jgi:hypothetical protein
MPSALPVCRLIISSNFVGVFGGSPGLGALDAGLNKSQIFATQP